MALIPPVFLDSVVAIGTIINNDDVAWVGTGFLVGKYLNDNMNGTKDYIPYLVTNKHVLNGLNKIVIRFNQQSENDVKDYVIDAINNDGKTIWTGHPDPNIDIAVILLNGEAIQKEGLKYGIFPSDTSLFKIKDMVEKEVTEGDFIYVLGFPMGLVAKNRQNVILRHGVIARIQDLYEKRSTDYIIDSLVYPGNSGGPVILKPESISIEGTKSNLTAGLIGIVKSYIPYQDVAISQQTKRPRITFEENSGLTLIEPVDYILETIKEEEVQNRKHS